MYLDLVQSYVCEQVTAAGIRLIGFATDLSITNTRRTRISKETTYCVKRAEGNRACGKHFAMYFEEYFRDNRGKHIGGFTFSSFLYFLFLPSTQFC